MKNQSNLKVTTRNDREVVMSRVFQAPRRLVWDAWTKPELVTRWLYGPEGWSMSRCECDLRVGGSLRYEWRHTRGTVMGLSGVYREVVSEKRIVQTELFDEDWTGGETLVTIDFVEDKGRTTVTMTVLYSSREARDGAVKTGMADGMEMGYVRIDKLLAEQEVLQFEQDWGRAIVPNDADAIGPFLPAADRL